MGSSAQSRRVVIIEDNFDLRDSFCELLMALGHQVEVAADGAEGLSLILEQHPDIAFVDIGLPDVSGYDVAQRVREKLGDEIFLVALTGYTQPDERVWALHYGFDAFITKPMTIAAVETLIQQSA